MIKCPKCSATLPDWAKSCQFCNTDTSKVPRPVTIKKQPDMSNVPQWVWGAYFALSAYFILKGGYDIYSAFVVSRKTFMGEEIGFGFMSYVLVIIGLLNIVIGIGLMLQLQLIRNIVNFVLGIQIIFGIIGLLLALPGIMLSGFFGFVSVLVQALQIAAACFMVFLIGETDKRAPNI